MAVRLATRRYADLGTFLREYATTLGVGALLLPAGTLDGEPAPEMKVDLVLPIVGRVGPLTGQVVSRLNDGAVALRVVSTSPAVGAGFAQIFGLADQVREWLLETGQVAVPKVAAPSATPEEVQRLQRRIVELEARARMAPTAPRAADTGAEPSDGGPRERGLPIPDLRDLAPALQGEMVGRSFRDALMALAVEKQTGVFVFERPDGRVRWGFWLKGGPVGWRTEPADEQEILGMLLYKAGSLTKEQLAESLEVMDRTGGRQGEALIEMGVFTFPQLVLLLQKQTDFVLQRVLREREGTWAFYLLDALPERFLTPPVRVASVLYRALLTHVKEMPAQELAGLLRPWLDRYVFVVPGVERTFEEMKLSVDEQQFVQIVQTTSYRLRELFAVSSLSRSQTAGAVWCLHDLNLLEFRDEATTGRDSVRWKREFDSRKLQSQGGTLFEQLDVHWICSSADVEAAWRRLRETWKPELAAQYGVEHREALQTIQVGLAAAYKVLANDMDRREYRAKVIEKMKIDQSAEMLSRKGEMAIMKAQAREANDCFTKALELCPGNPEYRDGLARSRTITAV